MPFKGMGSFQQFIQKIYAIRNLPASVYVLWNFTLKLAVIKEIINWYPKAITDKFDRYNARIMAFTINNIFKGRGGDPGLSCQRIDIIGNRFGCLSMHFANRNYFTSWSSPWNNSELKNSSIEIPRPSHNFFIVVTVVLWLRPLTMLFTVDCVTPLKRHNLLIDKLRSRHKSKILALTASPMSTGITSILYWRYPIELEMITSFELK